MPRSLSDLLLVHGRLDDLFLAHQEALVRLDLRTALDRLATFTEELHAHMRVEDNILIPVYEALGVHPTGASADIHRREHRQLANLLDGLTGRCASAKRDGPLTPRRILALLDREHTFKHLLEHHDQRERRFLYPILDCRLTDGKKASLWERTKREETR